jgi:NADH-quinone oxidoreductase subunit N
MKELLTLSLTGIFVMLSDMFNLRKLVFPLVLLGLATTISWCIFDWGYNQMIFRMMQIDNYALAFTVVMCSTALLWLVMSEDYFSKMAVSTDRYALILFAMVGALVMVSYTNMVMLFLGVEILSVSMYVLAGSNKTDLSSNEAALKYFLMGAFASGFLLFGIALIYGMSGSFDLLQIRSAIGKVTEANNSLLSVGILMILIGLGFKISAAPFHFWAPDVYQGSPTPITAFMATIVKTAAFGSLYRLFITCFPANTNVWSDIVAGMLVLTLLMGNVVAVMQRDAKRMLAFSSISHAGYMLFAVLCLNTDSDNSILFYTAAYSIATILAFTIIYIVSEKTSSTEIRAFNGLAKKNPNMAAAMTISLLSMAGIPPLAGFMAKYYIFANAISEGYLYLVLFAIVMSLVGVYYYFKIIIAMYFHENTEGGDFKANPLQNILILICSALLLLLGILPQFVYGVL